MTLLHTKFKDLVRVIVITAFDQYYLLIHQELKAEKKEQNPKKAFQDNFHRKSHHQRGYKR